MKLSGAVQRDGGGLVADRDIARQPQSFQTKILGRISDVLLVHHWDSIGSGHRGAKPGSMIGS
jgi:hypothetical protein